MDFDSRKIDDLYGSIELVDVPYGTFSIRYNDSRYFLYIDFYNANILCRYWDPEVKKRVNLSTTDPVYRNILMKADNIISKYKSCDCWHMEIRDNYYECVMCP